MRVLLLFIAGDVDLAAERAVTQPTAAAGVRGPDGRVAWQPKAPAVVVLTIEELEGLEADLLLAPWTLRCARWFLQGDRLWRLNPLVGISAVAGCAVLPTPGGFDLPRKTYGKVSHGMICSSDELRGRRRSARWHHRAAAGVLRSALAPPVSPAYHEVSTSRVTSTAAIVCRCAASPRIAIPPDD